MQKNNQSKAAALKTATPKNGYKVTPETTALLDCVRATNELYDMIAAAIEKKCSILSADASIAEIETEPYLEHVNAITDLLHEELRERLIDALSDTDNSSSDCVEI